MNLYYSNLSYVNFFNKVSWIFNISPDDDDYYDTDNA